MKRITVQITLSDNYNSAYHARKIKSAMVNAAVAKATYEDAEIHAIDTRIGNVRRK